MDKSGFGGIGNIKTNNKNKVLEKLHEERKARQEQSKKDKIAPKI